MICVVGDVGIVAGTILSLLVGSGRFLGSERASSSLDSIVCSVFMRFLSMRPLSVFSASSKSAYISWGLSPRRESSDDSSSPSFGRWLP